MITVYTQIETIYSDFRKITPTRINSRIDKKSYFNKHSDIKKDITKYFKTDTKCRFEFIKTVEKKALKPKIFSKNSFKKLNVETFGLKITSEQFKKIFQSNKKIDKNKFKNIFDCLYYAYNSWDIFNTIRKRNYYKKYVFLKDHDYCFPNKFI